MAIKYWNQYTDEVRVAQTEPHIAAFFNSSNLGPNALNGQDFGWRLAPEVVVEMRRIRENVSQMESIAIRTKKNIDEINDYDILVFISDKTDVESAPVAQKGDYSDKYVKEIMRLEGKMDPAEDLAARERELAKREADLMQKLKEAEVVKSTETPIVSGNDEKVVTPSSLTKPDSKSK